MKRFWILAIVLVSATAQARSIVPFPHAYNLERANFVGILRCVEGHKHTATYVVEESWKGFEEGEQFTIHIPRDPFSQPEWSWSQEGDRFLVVQSLFDVQNGKMIDPVTDKEYELEGFGFLGQKKPNADYARGWAHGVWSKLRPHLVPLREPYTDREYETLEEYKEFALDYLQLPADEREQRLLEEMTRLDFPGESPNLTEKMQESIKKKYKFGKLFDE